MARSLSQVLLLVSVAAWNLGTVRAETVDLKVTRVAVFSSGVAYFECEADVTDTATAELKFRSAQINDILKSLVLQDLNGGSISLVSYASMAPVQKALESFGVNITDNPSLGRLLDQLRGECVEVTGPRAIKGTIVGVEEHVAPFKDMPPDPGLIDRMPKVYLLNILTDMGLQQMKLNEVQSIKLTNAKIDAELRKALATLAASRDADKKTLTIRFDGKGKRHVRASYLLESPIWKTSYRLVLAAGKKPFLQGWAHAENSTDEDWKDVKLSLVSGRPISFTMDLYTPLYVPRPQETLEIYASLRAPEYAAGIRETSKEPPEGYGGGVAAKPRPAAPVQQLVGERVAGRRVLKEAKSEEQAVVGFALKDAGVESAAKAQQAGELFEYVIRNPVSIARQQSAMLPIVNNEIGGEKLSIYNPASHAKHPLNGLQVENTSDLNLMQGPVTIFDENVYAGDAKLPDLKPGEKRLVAYALDLGVEVTQERKPEPQTLIGLRAMKGTLLCRKKQVDERNYLVRNKDKRDRQVLIEQAYAADWNLVDPKNPHERTPNLLRFKVAVPANQTASQKVRLERVEEESIALVSTGLDTIQLYLRSQLISPALKEALAKVVALRTDLDRVARELAAREKEANEAVQEQGRLRENIKVLEKGSDIYQKQIKRFDDIETKIEQLRKQVADLRQDREKKQAGLEDYLLSLKVD